MTLSHDVIDGLPYVEGILNYLAPMAERPMNLAYEPPPGVPRSTGMPEPHRMMIYDARRIAGRLSLDSEGLAVVRIRHGLPLIQPLKTRPFQLICCPAKASN